ncbi:hypothetical protein C7212DRAFT_322493 [Tuber magnatum]|uniref:Autophagy-related protein 27 n=1 Tax=Tuber magnatum TaxID=42249 RepID=A0A317SM20_9PEZI|nr:hypothetical protein C7212DRAFT_322493 [Tuber magnatum]
MRTLTHLLSLTFSLTLLLSHLSPSTAYQHSTTGKSEQDNGHSLTQKLYLWPISAESPTPLYELWYHERREDAACSSAGHKNCAMTGECGDDEIVRVGIIDEEGVFRGVATTGKALKNLDKTLINIRRNRSDPKKVWRVEFQRVYDLEEPDVRATKPTPGPQPFLNKPIVLNAEGKLPEPDVEKTFLQKYWWVLLAGAFLVLSGGGSAE